MSRYKATPDAHLPSLGGVDQKVVLVPCMTCMTLPRVPRPCLGHGAAPGRQQRHPGHPWAGRGVDGGGGVPVRRRGKHADHPVGTTYCVTYETYLQSLKHGCAARTRRGRELPCVDSVTFHRGTATKPRPTADCSPRYACAAAGSCAPWAFRASCAPSPCPPSCLGGPTPLDGRGPPGQPQHQQQHQQRQEQQAPARVTAPC